MMTKCSKIRLQVSIFRTNGPLVIVFYQLFAAINEHLAPLNDGCQENRRQWNLLDEEYKQGL